MKQPSAVVSASATATLENNVAPALAVETDASEDSARLLVITDDRVAPEWLRVAQVVGFDYDLCEFSQALAMLKTSSYHAALVDVGAPQEAFALIERARRLPNCRQVPIAALADRDDVNSVFRAGASFAIPRPVTADLLENTFGAIYRVVVGLRRQYARYRVAFPLTLLLEDRTIEAKATDIGTGGLALVASEPLDFNARISVRFVLPGSEQEIVAFGEIRWTDHRGRAGLCFNSITASGRESLDDWMARRHLGIERPLVSLPHPPQPAPEPTSFDLPAAPSPRAGRIVLGAFLAAFCLLMMGFWIYFALTS